MLLDCASWHGGYKEKYGIITPLKDVWSMDGHGGKGQEKGGEGECTRRRDLEHERPGSCTSFLEVFGGVTKTV